MEQFHRLGERVQKRLKWPDLSARLASKLEWWFIQGQLDVGDGSRREFMVSLFRQKSKKDGADVHMALLSTLNPESGRNCGRSQASSAFVANFLQEAPDQLRKWGVDDLIIGAFINELDQSGPPRPIKVDRSVVALTSHPFEAQWNDFRMRQSGDGLVLEFCLPEDGGRWVLNARACAEWLTEETAGGGNGVGTMAYHSCPRLEVSGTVGATSARGKAWIDHQWGGFDWFRGTDDMPRVLGWEWFGINLSDGSDLIVLVHRDMRSRDVLATSAIFLTKDQPPKTVRDVMTTATRHWLSSETMIEYPVEWMIEIPSLFTKLEFKPATDNQEIPVFGFINAIWEGAGAVSGEISGKSVSGRARLELQGYGYIQDFEALLDRWVDRVDRSVASFLPRTFDEFSLTGHLGAPRWSYDADAHTEMLAQPAWDLMERGGKHWRPVFGLLLLEALGVDPGPFETALSVIPELVHTGSIIIDDIEDASELRRGEPTVHRKYGLATAINAANTLYFLPLLSITNHPQLSSDQRDGIYGAFMEMFVQAHFGQAQDLSWSKASPEKRAALWRDDQLGEKILQAHTLKTAAPVRVTADFACLIAGADRKTRAAIRRFAESVGVAFQIIDDVKNVSPSQDLGKTCGEDIRGGKFNYAVYQATRLLDEVQKRRLLDIVSCETQRQSDAGVREAIHLIEISGALEACERYAQELVDQDWDAFSRVLPASRQKMMIRMMLTKLIGRPFGMTVKADPNCREKPV